MFDVFRSATFSGHELILSRNIEFLQPRVNDYFSKMLNVFFKCHVLVTVNRDGNDMTFPREKITQVK